MVFTICHRFWCKLKYSVDFEIGVVRKVWNMGTFMDFLFSVVAQDFVQYVWGNTYHYGNGGHVVSTRGHVTFTKVMWPMVWVMWLQHVSSVREDLIKQVDLVWKYYLTVRVSTGQTEWNMYVGEIKKVRWNFEMCGLWGRKCKLKGFFSLFTSNFKTSYLHDSDYEGCSDSLSLYYQNVLFPPRSIRYLMFERKFVMSFFAPPITL